MRPLWSRRTGREPCGQVLQSNISLAEPELTGPRVHPHKINAADSPCLFFIDDGGDAVRLSLERVLKSEWLPGQSSLPHSPDEFQFAVKLPRFPGAPPSFESHAMSEERLVNIETKIAFQEDVIEELNKTIYQQQKKLERLEATCEALARHLSSLAESVNEIAPGGNERPPHY
ncbi:MAG TPA: SlyX family protein [Gallionellaceae bacterium]|nr:SlyX family protein [Gallionellaceae bacterium]